VKCARPTNRNSHHEDTKPQRDTKTAITNHTNEKRITRMKAWIPAPRSESRTSFAGMTAQPMAAQRIESREWKAEDKNLKHCPRRHTKDAKVKPNPPFIPLFQRGKSARIPPCRDFAPRGSGRAWRKKKRAHSRAPLQKREKKWAVREPPLQNLKDCG